MHLFELIAQAISGLSEVTPDEKTNNRTYLLRILLVVGLLVLILAPFVFFFEF